MSPLLWALALLLLGCFFLVLEFFVPSSGLLGILAAVSLIGAIALGFSASPGIGATILFLELLIVPVTLGLAIKYWPETPIGRMMLIQRPESPDEVLPETEAYRSLHTLVGCYGVARSLMMPSGSVQIEGKTYDAVSEGSAIDPGQRVIVVSVSTQRLIVRLDEAPLHNPLAEKLSSPPIAPSPADPSLTKPSPFEEPLEGI